MRIEIGFLSPPLTSQLKSLGLPREKLSHLDKIADALNHCYGAGILSEKEWKAGAKRLIQSVQRVVDDKRRAKR